MRIQFLHTEMRLANVLNTYLELTDLYGREEVWTEYERSLEKISPKHHKVDILNCMAEEMQTLLPLGGVSILLRGMEVWIIVFNTSDSEITPVPGLGDGGESRWRMMRCRKESPSFRFTLTRIQNGFPVMSVTLKEQPLLFLLLLMAAGMEWF